MYNPLLQPDLKLMLQEDDELGLREFCNVLYPVVVAEVLDGMEPADVWRVLSACDVHRQAEIFEFIAPTQQLELVESVDKKVLSTLIEAMAPDDRVDLLENMPEEQVEALLPLIAQAERDDIRRLLSYPEDSAGSIMTTEYASLPEDITVREALDRLRQQAPNRETIYYVYVLDEQRRLDGVITLRQLILARPAAILVDLMRRNPIVVHVEDDKVEAARQLARFDLLALPVVDDQNRLVGMITHDDVLDVVQEEALEDAYRQSAIQPLEHSYFETPLLEIAWKRGIWLMLLAFFALLTAGIQDLFDGVTEGHKFLALFLPLVLASGGNTGSQSATLVIRAIAVAVMDRHERLQLARREFFTGLMLGSCLALFSFVAIHWVFRQTVMESAVVAATIGLVVTMGTLTGSMLPLIFKRIGMDPAIMSNPLIAALSDMLGVVIYYSVAALVLDRLLLG